MSSVFVSFCFAKTVSGGDKYIAGSASYRTNIHDDDFREITFKGFTDFFSSSRSILPPDAVYIPTPADLPSSLPLLLCSATAVQDSYLSSSNGGRESFVLAQHLYNAVTSNKNVSSKVIVSYKNKNKRYDAVKNNLQKSVVSVVGRLKVGSTNIPHIIASDIEWTYVSNYHSMLSPDKGKSYSRDSLDSQLNDIEEKYASLTSSPSLKKPNATLHSFSAKPAPKANTSPINFVDILSQVQNSSMQSNTRNPSYTPSFTKDQDNQDNPPPSTSVTNTFSHNNEGNSTPVDSAKPFTSVSSDTPISHQTTPEPQKNGKNVPFLQKNNMPFFLTIICI
ncbi:31489_t:CDS:2 [Gigaspora margarita]|uniref:31489_t:CDS:1 n=1 Tax=Gigaspora margarita TaxID=4874 RepID=A0ABN7UI12_GIGMA|nr:31489_t:CDS:2 [Gigaspora margarita]